MYTTELWEYGVENVGRAKIGETNGRTSVSLSARSFTLFHAHIVDSAFETKLMQSFKSFLSLTLSFCCIRCCIKTDT